MIDSRKDNARALFSAERKAQKWNDLYEKGGELLDYHFALRRNEAAQYVFKHLDRQARILDLGCGAGVLSEMLLDNGYCVDCADMSPDMLAFAQKRLERFGTGRYQLTEADAEDLPFEDGRYDAVVSMGMFGYLDDDDKAFKEIYRILKPGGLLLMSVRNRRNQYLFDPVKLPKKVLYRMPVQALRDLKRYVFSGNSSDTTETRMSRTRRFRIDILDSPRNIIRGIEGHGFSSIEFIGLGYGPPMFNGHQIIGHRLAITGSAFLAGLFKVTRTQGLSKWFADISIYAFRKK